MVTSTVGQTSTDERVVRCAVFKIDLKGRFVYIDDFTEELLRSPKETLFGRSLKDFVSEESYVILTSIFQRMRHYETSFEAVEFELHDSTDQKNRFWAVISLNFIAGNPSNYQVILIPLPPKQEEADSEDANGAALQELAGLIGSLDADVPWDRIAGIFVNLTGVVRAEIYAFDDDRFRRLGLAVLHDVRIDVEVSPADPAHKGVVMYHQPLKIFPYVPPQSVSFLESESFTEVCYPLMDRELSWGMARFIVKGDLTAVDSHLEQACRLLGKSVSSFAVQK